MMHDNDRLPFAKKSLGQHWLTDSTSLKRIVSAADITPADTVLEIGPGVGTLTTYLVRSAQKVVAVEFDTALADDLPRLVPADNLEVVHSDIMKFNLTTLPANYKVVANIPYYLTSGLLRTLCESSNPPKTMVLLIQKEVAERAAAQPGKMSLLSVSVQFYCDVSLRDVLPAHLFTPPPKVDSQILGLVYRGSRYDDMTPSQFFRVVKAGFANRRKTVLNSLSAGLHVDKASVTKFLDDAHINPKSRPQELGLDDWHNIALAALSTTK